jgi:hypothetical protein
MLRGSDGFVYLLVAVLHELYRQVELFAVFVLGGGELTQLTQQKLVPAQDQILMRKSGVVVVGVAVPRQALDGFYKKRLQEG